MKQFKKESAGSRKDNRPIRISDKIRFPIPVHCGSFDPIQVVMRFTCNVATNVSSKSINLRRLRLLRSEQNQSKLSVRFSVQSDSRLFVFFPKLINVSFLFSTEIEQVHASRSCLFLYVARFLQQDAQVPPALLRLPGVHLSHGFAHCPPPDTFRSTQRSSQRCRLLRWWWSTWFPCVYNAAYAAKKTLNKPKNVS